MASDEAYGATRAPPARPGADHQATLLISLTGLAGLATIGAIELGHIGITAIAVAALLGFIARNGVLR